MSTFNQAAQGNQNMNYGQTGNLGGYFMNSGSTFLQNGLNGNGWNFKSAFGDQIGANGKAFNSKLGGADGSITGFDNAIGAAAGYVGGLLDKSAAHQRTSGKYGYVANTVDSVANTVGMVGNFNPLASGAGKLAMGAVNKFTGGTDGMTVQDSLLGSSAVQGALTGIAAATGPIGWGVAGAYLLASGINSAFGSTTTDNMYKSFMDKDKMSEVADAYSDMDLENEANSLYGKKYGLFSKSAYKKAEKKVKEAQMRMTNKIDIRDTAKLGQIRAGMVDANRLNYQMAINGGYKPLAIGRRGLKIDPERLAEAKRIAKCIKQKKLASTNVIPAEAREAMRDVTKMPSDVMPTFGKGGKNYKNGQHVKTNQCAEFSNGELRDRGYTLTYGDAWNLKNQDLVYSGYNKDAKPENFDLNQVIKYNHDAADRLYKEFDSKTLDKDSVYTVNMYYNGSPSQETAYKEGRDSITGTHTGYLQFNPKTKKWEVIHNIHGTVHVDPFVSIQGSKGKYGVTAIYKPRETTIWNRFRGMLGLEEGGEINYFQNGGTVNVIPEGALHARKHHMENDEHITKKGIPVVDVNGTQQAEIERNEIIFRKEVTNKLEELAKEDSDEAAIEAGKLLAQEIIENTDDRTGLIQQVTGDSFEKIPMGANGFSIDSGTIANAATNVIGTFIAGRKAQKLKEEQEKLALEKQNLEAQKQASEFQKGFLNYKAQTDQNGNVSVVMLNNESTMNPDDIKAKEDALNKQQGELLKQQQAQEKNQSNYLNQLVQGISSIDFGALTKGKSNIPDPNKASTANAANITKVATEPNIPDKIELKKDGDKLPDVHLGLLEELKKLSPEQLKELQAILKYLNQ